MFSKDTIEQWLNLELFNLTNEMIVMSKSVFSKIHSKLDNLSLDNIAKYFADLFSDIMKFSTTKSMSEETLKLYTAFLIKFFDQNGLK